MRLTLSRSDRSARVYGWVVAAVLVSACVPAQGRQAATLQGGQATVPDKATPKTIVYDISDLLYVPQAATVGSLLTEEPIAGGNGVGSEGRKAVASATAETLSNPEARQWRLAATVSSRLPDGATCKPFQTGTSYTLVVTAPESAHHKLEQFLNSARALQQRQVSVENRLVTLPTAVIARLPEALQDKIARAEAVATVHETISAVERDAILSELKKDSAATLATPPRITVFAGQASRMLVGEYQFFATDMKLDAKGEAKPETSSVFSGLQWALRCSPSADGSAVGMSLAFAQSKLASVKNVPWKGAEALGRKDLVVQVPTVDRTTWEGEVVLSSGSVGLIFVGAEPDRSALRLLMVEPTIIGMQRKP